MPSIINSHTNGSPTYAIGGLANSICSVDTKLEVIIDVWSHHLTVHIDPNNINETVIVQYENDNLKFVLISELEGKLSTYSITPGASIHDVLKLLICHDPEIIITGRDGSHYAKNCLLRNY